MRIIIALLIITIVMLSGCSSEKDEYLANDYKLELHYFDRAVKQAKLNLTDEAYVSCKYTHMLRSECFASIAQNLILNKQEYEIRMCDEIKPTYRMNMTMGAFRLVYPVIDDNLKKELRQQMRPSNERVMQLQNIKEMCIKRGS